MQDLKEKILCEPLVRKVLQSGKEVFLVGGYLRDVLRGTRSRDIDFVVRGDPRAVLSDILRDQEGTLVEFREFLMVRVVAGEYTLDFTELEGRLEDDLLRRDFTVNAIAWSVAGGIVDPLKGASDIRKGILRAVSEKNLVDDPVRLLRAYRFAAELGWKIDEKTRKMVRKLNALVRKSASERITLEIFKLLNSDGHLRALNQAFTDGLLKELFTFYNNGLRTKLKALSRLNLFLKKIPEDQPVSLDKPFSHGLSFGGLLRSEQLLYGYDPERSRLSVSKAISKRLAVTSSLLKRYEEQRQMDDGMIFDLLTEAGDAAIDFALLTRSLRLLKKTRRFLGIKPALSAERVMQITGLCPGPELGRALHEMKKMQFLRKIRVGRDLEKWLANV